MTNGNKRVYFNPAQQRVMFTGANKTVIVGGRRLGKSHGIAAPWVERNMQRMPRSAGAFVGATFAQLLTRTLPGTLTALESIGFKRNVHFYVGRKPPKSANFATPHITPECWNYVVSFYNGSIAHLISQDREGTSNSFTLDWLCMDEAKLLDYYKLKNETFPANGGYRGHFGHCPWHHSELIISDMPNTKKGSWFLNYKDQCDTELISAIQAIVFDIWSKRKQIYELSLRGGNTKSLEKEVAYLDKKLSQFRAVATHYEEISSIQNLLVLGESYIRKMKRDLPPLVFQTSILCKRIGVLTDGFYSALNEAVHYYTSKDNSYLDSCDYDFQRIGTSGSLIDADVKPFDPICIGMDYNANINWIVAAQQDGRKLRVLKSFYAKYDRKIKEVVQDFCKYYETKPLKDVVFYYDSTALGSNYAVNDDDFASIIISEFEALGWRVIPVYLGNPIHHREKHILINQALKGQSGLFPVFNRDNNEALLLAMENTGVYQGRNGFTKDKRGEKLAETEEDLLENRTDGTDAFDTVYIGMTTRPQVGGYVPEVSSFMR